jgi:DegV family protein with EDD domain
LNEKIAQIVDSAGNLPRDILEKYQIIEVPFYYTFDGDTYFQENAEYSTVDFYQIMQERSNQAPRTAAPNMNDWIQAFKKAHENGYKKIIVTTISQALSSSYNNANLAQKMYLSNVKDLEIEIIASNSCSCGQAALEIKIAQMIHDAYLSWKDICTITKASIPYLTTLFTVKDLYYMKAGGRIGGATAFMGHILNIKPICEFVKGVVRPVKAVRGRNNSLLAMANIAISRLTQLSNPVICTQNALCDEEESFIIKHVLSGLSSDVPIYRGILGTVVGAHSGPASIGIGFVGDIPGNIY